jgi:beta-phosphoglucomutase family hydrolase
MVSSSPSAGVVRSDLYDAWLFDLDGVITRTARVHARAWKRTFDEYLQHVADRTAAPFVPFEIDPEYYSYVDGKPRYEGVDSFLRSRGIALEWGDPGDAPNVETVCGIGNRKNSLFQQVLEEEGVEIFPASIALIGALHDQGKRVAVVTSSKNCDLVLRTANLSNLFEVRVDGNTAAARMLPGKPKPDTFLAATEELGVPPERAVVVEDAIAGVAAGKAGGFGLVLGVARQDDMEALREHGADLVVRDLAEITLE